MVLRGEGFVAAAFHTRAVMRTDGADADGIMAPFTLVTICYSVQWLSLTEHLWIRYYVVLEHVESRQEARR
jgi:hypothetical protein